MTMPNLAHDRYYELDARQRISALVDQASFHEIIPPGAKQSSPHLTALDLPVAFDDGVIIGEATFAGEEIYIIAQQGKFMGGAVGEVHGAKISGLLQRALKHPKSAVVFLIDSGGVRLHEANAGEIAISEIIHGVMQLRLNGITTIGIVCGGNGAYGGLGITSACLDYLIINEQGRCGVSGAEVIETVMGTEEFDASDRALVWRTYGGKHRYILKDADYFVGDSISHDIAPILKQCLAKPKPLTLDSLKQQHQQLNQRLSKFQTQKDALDIWQALGSNEPQRIPELECAEFLKISKGLRDAN